MRTILTVLGVGLGGYLLYQWWQTRQAAAPLTVVNVSAGDRATLLSQGWTVAPNGSLLPPAPVSSLPTIPFQGWG